MAGAVDKIGDPLKVTDNELAINKYYIFLFRSFFLDFLDLWNLFGRL